MVSRVETGAAARSHRCPWRFPPCSARPPPSLPDDADAIGRW